MIRAFRFSSHHGVLQMHHPVMVRLGYWGPIYRITMVKMVTVVIVKVRERIVIYVIKYREKFI